FLEIDQSFIGYEFSLFIGDIHFIQKIHLVFLFQSLNKMYGSVNRTTCGCTYLLIQSNNNKAFVNYFVARLQVAAMSRPIFYKDIQFGFELHYFVIRKRTVALINPNFGLFG